MLHPILPVLQFLWSFCLEEQLLATLPDSSNHGQHQYTIIGSDSSELQTTRRLEDEGNEWMEWVLGLVYVIIIVSVHVLVTMQYKPRVTERRQPFPAVIPGEYSLANNTWRFGLFDCGGNCQTCLHGTFLPGTTMADHYEVTGVSPFWTAFGMWLSYNTVRDVAAICLRFTVSHIVADGSMNVESMRYFRTNTWGYDWVANFIFGAAWAVCFAKQRQRLRLKLGALTPGNFFEDYATMWCCLCCAVIQETRQVNAIQKAQVNCCFALQDLSGMDQVGAPIQVQVIGGAGTVLGGQHSSLVQGTVVGQPVQATPVGGSPAKVAPQPSPQPPVVQATLVK